jgi:hypothetical protein
MADPYEQARLAELLRRPQAEGGEYGMPYMPPLPPRDPGSIENIKRPGEYTQPIAEMTGPPLIGPGGNLAKMLMKGAGLGAAGAIVATPSEAGNGSELDPRLSKIKDLDNEIAVHRSKLEAMAKTNLQSKTARDNASQPYLDAISQLMQRKAAIEGELDAEAKASANSSFAKAHPALNAMWPAIQWGGPVAAAMLTRGAGNMAERGLNKPWRNAVDAAEEAMFKPGQEAKAAYNTLKAQEHLALEPKGALGRGARRVEDYARETAIPTLAGAGVGMEAALFRSQYDRGNAPVGSPERAAAEKALGENFWDTASQGFVPGFLGGFTGSHLPNIGPGYRPRAETEALGKFLKRGETPAPSPSSSPAPAPPPGPQGGLAPPEARSPLPGVVSNQPTLTSVLKSMPEQANQTAIPKGVKRHQDWDDRMSGSKVRNKKTGRLEDMPGE